MIFPAGFTGFGFPKGTPIPLVDLDLFKSVCYAAALLLDGKVLAFEFADVTPNFQCATIEWGREPVRVSILCNRHYYIVGFCVPRRNCAIDYIDSPELASALAKVIDWQLLSKADLETEVDQAILESMSKSDRRTIETARRKDWFSPARTVGDVLFHFWD